MLHPIEMGCNGKPLHYICLALLCSFVDFSNEQLNVGICHWFIKEDDQSPSYTRRVTVERMSKQISFSMKNKNEERKTWSDKKEDMPLRGRVWKVDHFYQHIVCYEHKHRTKTSVDSLFLSIFDEYLILSLSIQRCDWHAQHSTKLYREMRVRTACMQWAVAPKKHFCHRSFPIPKINSGTLTHTRTLTGIMSWAYLISRS